MTAPGALHLIPNTLDFGAPGAPAALDELLPRDAIRVAARLGDWVCENAKTTRAFLKRVDAVPITMQVPPVGHKDCSTSLISLSFSSCARKRAQ